MAEGRSESVEINGSADDDNDVGGSAGDIIKDLIEARRRCEAVQFALDYAKAEKREMLKMKDDEIQQLDNEKDELTDKLNESEWEIESLKAHVDELKSEVTRLEKEKRKWDALDGSKKGQEDSRLRSELSAVGGKLRTLEEQIRQKCIEKDDLRRLLDNQSAMFHEMQIKLDEKLDMHRAKLSEEVGAQLNKHTKKVEKVIVEQMDQALNAVVKKQQGHGDGRASNRPQRTVLENYMHIELKTLPE